MSRTTRKPREFDRIIATEVGGIAAVVEVQMEAQMVHFAVSYKNATGWHDMGLAHEYIADLRSIAHVRRCSIETLIADEAVRHARRIVTNGYGATDTFGRKLDQLISYRGLIESEARRAGMPLYPFAISFPDEYKHTVRLRHSGGGWLR